MRCPECGEGILYQCRAKLKNGEHTTVFVCDEADDSWAGEVCRERAISFDDIIEYEEASTEVDGRKVKYQSLPVRIAERKD